MLNSFYRYLETYRIKPLDPHAKIKTTHVSIGNPKGKYHIPNNKNEEFLLFYVKSIENKEHIHLNEVAKNPVTGDTVTEMKIRIDLDIKQSIDLSERQITIEHIIKFVVVYNGLIKKYINIDVDDQKNKMNLYAFVTMRKKPYRFNGNYHDGVHIMYPSITCSTEIQLTMRDELLSEMPRIFEGVQIKNNFIDMFDKQVITSPSWLLYGSSKTKTNKDRSQLILEPYMLTHIINKDGKLVKISKTLTHLRLTRMLSTRSVIHRYLVKHEYQEMMNLRTLRLNNTEKPIITEDGTFQLLPAPTHDLFQSSTNNENLTPEKHEEIVQLVEMLSYDRTFYYTDWKDVGMCLKGIDPILLGLWDKFSRRCEEKYKIGECVEKWNTFKSANSNKNDRFFKEGTLHMWAKQDNPQTYSKFINGDSLIAKIKKACEDQSNTNVAEILYHTCKYKFCCSQYKSDRWYEFREHHWHMSDGGVDVMKQLTQQIRLSIMKYATNCNQIVNERLNDEVITNEQINYMTKALELLGEKKLGSFNFKRDVMKECKSYFYNKEFEEKLDETRYLIGFNNGVYNLRKDEFRDGHPDDYISFTTGIDYIEIEDEDPRIKQVNRFMSELFPDEELCEYVWRLLSTFVSGERIGDAMFPIFTGVGSNGKSKLIELLHMVLGNYCQKINITQLTQTRKHGSNANSELAQTKGKRFLHADETDDNNVLQLGFMKELTGGDTISTRALYKDNMEFTPQFTIILLCNILPKIRSDDEGTWRRILVIPFMSRFVDNPDPNDQYQYKKDLYLSDKIHSWKEVFMFMLLSYFKLVKKEGLHPPQVVVQASEAYRIQNDIVGEYVTECIIHKDGSHVGISRVYSHYKTWLRTTHEGADVLTLNNFKIAFKKKLPNITTSSRGFIDIDLVMPDDDDVTNVCAGIPDELVL